MSDLTGRERVVIGILTVLTASALIYSTDRLMIDGILTWAMEQREYLIMAGETAGIFGLFALALRFSPSFTVRAAALLGICGIFLWVHRAFDAVVVSGLYGGYLWAVGKWVLGKVSGGRVKHTGAEREFLTGCVSVVCMFCLMSALGVGRIAWLWVFVAVSAAVAAIDRRRQSGRLRRAWKARDIKPASGPVTVRWNWGRAFLWAAVLTFFCVQAGRMNIAVDFDSLWYGVRSPYILDNGRGIYENMGNIGIVYTYSKGFEVLTLPLSVLPSFSFVTAFNLWLLAGILWIFGKILEICAGTGRRRAGAAGRMQEYGTAGEETKRTVSGAEAPEDVWDSAQEASGQAGGAAEEAPEGAARRAGEIGICFLASLPGIMNMGITAKSDVATLCFQMILFYEMLLFLRGDRQALWYGWAAFFFSWTMKPTALVFSTAVMGMSMVFFAATGKLWQGRDKREKATGKAAGKAVFALSLLSLGGIWARTFLITGLPVTSVFSSVLTKLGFQMKYPFNVQKLPNSSAGVSKTQWLRDMAARIWGVLFNPQGPDMDHVILAWGSLAVWFCICVCGAWLFLGKRERTKEERMLDRYLHTVFWPFAGCSTVSLLMLTQVDGNYFMLFYVLLIIYTFRLVCRLPQKAAVRGILWPGAAVLVFSGIVMTLTNWSWTVGFTPGALRHRGYYDHRNEQHRQMVETGNERIWEILAADPRHRLIAIGEHPEVLAFPCNVQSYSDITGTWGNVVLVKYMDNFVEFMRYGRTDYVYAQAGYISRKERAWSLTCDLIEYGVLTPVCFEQGNMLAKVNGEEGRTEESVRHLEEFLENYVWKE